VQDGTPRAEIDERVASLTSLNAYLADALLVGEVRSCKRSPTPATPPSPHKPNQSLGWTGRFCAMSGVAKVSARTSMAILRPPPAAAWIRTMFYRQSPVNTGDWVGP
jgi:hypothetical protein